MSESPNQPDQTPQPHIAGQAPPSPPAPRAAAPPAFVAQPAYGQPYPHYYAPPVQKTNGLSIASLVLGLLPICFGITSILAIIFGLVARGQIKRSNGAEGGDGMAIAGVILGGIGVVLAIVWFAVILSGHHYTTTHRDTYNDVCRTNPAACDYKPD